jgi:hypothetical protein
MQMSTPARVPLFKQSGTIELRIPPKDIKRLDDPHDENRYAYECQVPVSEAAKLIIGSANPRKQDLGKSLSRDILRTLQTEPELFHLRNRGIWVAAARAEYDNQKQALTLHCPQDSDQRYGVVDGGHTKAIIDEFLNSLAEQSSDQHRPTPHVILHVRVGVEDALEEMAVSLNRSTQLKEYALDDFKGEFDELKAIFSKTPFANDIGYTENEDKEYDVLDVIQRLTLFCVGIYPNRGDAHPVVAYSFKAKCLQQFVKSKASYLALKPIMAECFRLPDQIEVILPEVSGSERFGNFNFVRKQKPSVAPSMKNVPTNGVADNWRSGYNVSEAVLYPLAAALRVLVRAKPDGTVLGWRQDPVKFFKANGGELFDFVRKYYEGAAKSLTALGKNSEFWAKLHHSAYVALHPED